MGAAQMGRAFAEDISVLCDVLAKDHDSSSLNERLSKLISIADKGYGRSVQARGQLICVRVALSEVRFTVMNDLDLKVDILINPKISSDILTQVSKLKDGTPKGPGYNALNSFLLNGANTCFVTLPYEAPAGNDTIDTDIWNPAISAAWTPCELNIQL